MSQRIPLAQPQLTILLNALLNEESLPPVDRWYSAYARKAGWSPREQKRHWDDLRRALGRGFGLLSDQAPQHTTWAGFRVALKGRGAEWAIRACQPAATHPGPVQAGIPGWLAPAFEDRCRKSGWTAEQREHFLHSQEIPAPVHVRFRSEAEGRACAERLRSAGFSEPSDVEGIDQLTGGPGLETTEDWKSGLVEIQDAASQLSLNRLGIRPGMRVWDVCAGQGGKTLLAARELRGKGTLVASDVAEGKLKSLKERVRRSGWQNIRILPWDGLQVPDFGPEGGGKGFDRVVIDAPCSASGTWRRDPEGRYRLHPRVLKELASHQARLIRLGWEALKPGGRLAYITCSWIPAEDEDIVDAFVAETGADLIHQELLGLPWFDANTLFTAILEKPQAR